MFEGKNVERPTLDLSTCSNLIHLFIDDDHLYIDCALESLLTLPSLGQLRTFTARIRYSRGPLMPRHSVDHFMRHLRRGDILCIGGYCSIIYYSRSELYNLELGITTIRLVQMMQSRDSKVLPYNLTVSEKAFGEESFTSVIDIFIHRKLPFLEVMLGDLLGL